MTTLARAQLSRNCSAIWSADPSTFTHFPMRSYARFMQNHGLLGVAARAPWRTITGGSRRYLEALTRLSGKGLTD